MQPRNAQRSNGNGRRNPPKPTQLSSDKQSDLKLAYNKDLPEAFVVLISRIGFRPVQMTFHHPIGETQLDDGEWVATPSESIPFLLARTENPYEKSVMEKRRESVLRNVTRALLDEREDGEMSYRGTNISRTATLALARKRQATAWKSAKADNRAEFEEYLRKNYPELPPQSKQQKLMGVKFPTPAKPPLDNFLDSDVITLENKIRALSNKIAESAELQEKYPIPEFETMGGPLGDQPQVVIAGLQDLDTSMAMDAVIRRVHGKGDG